MIKAVEALKNSGLFTVDEDHDWGYQLRLINTGKYCAKFLVLENNEPGSLHNHYDKTESWILLCGSVEVYVESGQGYMLTKTISPGQKIYIKDFYYHRMKAIRHPAVILEASTHDDDEDTHRADAGCAARLIKRHNMHCELYESFHLVPLKEGDKE